MPLRRTQVTIPILGLDTNADPKSAPPGTLDIAENVVFRRTPAGGGEVRKRFGALSRTKNMSSIALVGGRKLASRGNEQLMFSNGSTLQTINGQHLATWSPQAGLWEPTVRLNQNGNQVANAPRVGITAEAARTINFPASVSNVDVAFGGGLVCYAFIAQNGSQPQAVMTFLDRATGAWIAGTGCPSASGASVVKVIALSDRFLFFYSFTSGNNLTSCSFLYSAVGTGGTTSSAVNVATDLATTGSAHIWDVTRNGANDSVMVAYQSSAAPKNKFVLWNAALTSGGTASNTDTPVAMCWLNWTFADGFGYLSYVDATFGLVTSKVQQSPFSISSNTVEDATCTAALNIVGYRRVGNQIFIEQNGSTSTSKNNLIKRFYTSGGAAFIAQRGATILSKVFTRGGFYYITIGYDNMTTPGAVPAGTIQIDSRTNYVVDVTDTGVASPTFVNAFSHVAKAFSGQAAGLDPRFSPCSCAVIDSDTVAIPMKRSSGLGSGALTTDAPTGTIHLATLDFSGAGFSAPAQLGGSLYLPGGVVRQYDGVCVFEAGFSNIPDFPVVTASVGSSSLTLLATYQVKYCWLFVDANGEEHRSAFSPPVKVTLTGTQNTLAVVCQNYQLTEKSIGFSSFIEVYMTAGNGSTFTRVTAMQNTGGGFGGTDSKTYTTAVGLDDTAIALCPEAYDTGGELDHEPFPPAKLVCSWSNRLFLSGTDNPTELWVSDELIPGEGVGVSSANAITMEQEGGPVTALAEMDDRLIIGKHNGNNDSLYELIGRGPAPNGEGNFEQPARITATCGPVNPDALVKTPQGVIFKSTRGFYLLPIGGGLPIRLRAPESFESLTITGAVVMEDVEQVRFVSSSGTTLVYHFGFGDAQGLGWWSTFTGQTAVDCAIWAGKFVYLQSDGTVQEETTGYADNGASITEKVRLAWLSPAGIFGDVRVWALRWLTEFMATLTLAMSMELDFAASVVQSPTLAVTAASAIPAELKPVRQDAAAYRLTLQETSTTEGFRLTALVLELGAHGLLKPLAATQRMT